MARVASTGPMKAQAARQMRRTAAMLDVDHPETVAGDHLRDAAKMLDRGQMDSTKRHLDAAMEVLTPRNLYRHGITDDEGHATAKHHMHQVHRHRLAVEDIEDTRGSNDRLRSMARAARGQPEPRQPFHRPPPQLPDGQQAVAAAGQPGKTIDLVGPKGYVHGWIYVGGGSIPLRGDKMPDAASSAAQSHFASSERSRSTGVNVIPRAGRFDTQTAVGLAPAGEHYHVSPSGVVSHRNAPAPAPLKAVPGPSREKGFRGPIGSSSLPADIKKSLLGYQRDIASGAIRFDKGKFASQYPGKKKSSQSLSGFMRRTAPTSLAGQVTASGAITLAGPEGYVHGWVKVGDAGHLHGKQVVGTDSRGNTFLGTYQHPGKVAPRHASPRAATKVRIAAGSGEPVAARRPVRPFTRFTKYRQAMAYGIANDRPGIELSARTAMLQRTPAPRGRPGGPGLYHVKGMGHTPYLQQVVKALIEKRGMPPGKAYAVARAAIRKWSVRSKHPEVRSAAAGAEAGEIARQASAHRHTADAWQVADALIELACDSAPGAVIDLFNPYHAPTGQFTTASGAGAGQAQGKAAKRKKLVKEIASLRAQIAALRAQLPAPRHGPVRHRSGTPAKRGAAATSARQARQGKTTAGKAGKAAPARMSPATIHAKIAALRAQLQADVAQLRSLR